MGDDAESLGLVFSEETTKAAERLGDAQVRLKQVFGGLGRQISSDLIPALADSAEELVGWLRENSDEIRAWVTGVVEQMTDAAKAAAEWVGSVDWEGVWGQIQEVGEVVSTVIDLIMEMTDALGGAGAATLALGVAATSSGGLLGGLAVAGTAAGYAIGSAMNRAKNEILGLNVEMGRLAGRARDIQAIAKIQSDMDAMDEPDRKAEAQATRNADLQGKADRAGERARKAAKKIHGGRVPKSVEAEIAHMERVISTGSASQASLRGARATLDSLEGRAAKRKTRPSGSGGKPAPKSAASAAVESDIKSFAETAGRGAYARAIQAGATEKEANKAALAEQKKVAKDLKARAPELIKAGTLGQGTSALAGTPLTAGGALPIALDLGSKGGPPPVQVINAPATITFDFPNATFDATMSDLGPMIEPVIQAEMSKIWGRILPNYSTGQIR